jgi:hypothetical protein
MGNRPSTVPLALPAAILAAALLLPFHDKAFTIDDTLFLHQAEHLLTDPLHPTAFAMAWTESPWPQRMSAIMPSGPVMAYLLVPCVVAGGREWIGHVTQLVLFTIGLWATASLAIRLGLSSTSAGFASFVVVATPAALAMTSTCMPDTPAMAFGVLGVERAVAWRDERRLHQLFVAALALALAALARPHLALVWGVATLLVGWRDALPAAIAPILVAVFTLVTRDPEASASGALGAISKFSGLEHVLSGTIAFFTHWSLALPLGIPWLVLHPKRMARRPVLYVAAAAAVTALVMAKARQPILVGAAAGIGLAAIWDVLDDARRRGDRTRLALGVWLLVPAPIVLYQHLPPKYLVASAPAVAILLASELEQRTEATRRRFAAAIICVGVGLGVLIVRADAQFADVGRIAVRELIAPNIAAGHRVWFDGHWGFQWYAEKAGATCMTAAPPRPAIGDLAVSNEHTGAAVEALFPNAAVLDTVVRGGSGGRVMSFALGAGFYNNAWGYLPWAWGDDFIDRYALWRLE